MSKLIGMMLVEDRIITFDELSLALNYQSEHGGLVGEILVEFGYLDAETLERYLEKQKEYNRNHEYK
jgi:hypothetical protein